METRYSPSTAETLFRAFFCFMAIEIIHNIHTDSLEEAGFSVRRGWDKNLAQNLVRGSREPTMAVHVPRDMNERFSDVDAAQKWFNNDPERVIYALARQAIVAGVIWFSYQPQSKLKADYTFAIRMYEVARGQGHAGDFLEAAHTDFGSEAIWLETDEVNVSAINLYRAHGYDQVAKSNGRIMMVRPHSNDRK